MPAHQSSTLAATACSPVKARTTEQEVSDGSPATLADVHDCDALHEMALPADPWNDPDPVVFVAAWLRESGLALAQDDEEAAELLHAVGRMATDLLGSRGELAHKRRALTQARARMVRLESALDRAEAEIAHLKRALRDAA